MAVAQPSPFCCHSTASNVTSNQELSSTRTRPIPSTTSHPKDYHTIPQFPCIPLRRIAWLITGGITLPNVSWILAAQTRLCAQFFLQHAQPLTSHTNTNLPLPSNNMSQLTWSPWYKQPMSPQLKRSLVLTPTCLPSTGESYYTKPEHYAEWCEANCETNVGTQVPD